ncbi:hypothetical protein F3Y22_tig00112226pilonHSYRG00045 [Hibiscus syriacus]|uniref:Disease resistance protein winged helix domain-containing protein n=1 Tax=Hibiscus syriacus TaxID=106335 RepID=A0A6A2XII9_HIBSY|nr:hypothetical protein F3Y22_tig00112226pilonHSYRG00045 [Hibiscus syriacus]
MTKIIVTTRLQNVSVNVDPIKAFHLDKLSQEDSTAKGSFLRTTKNLDEWERTYESEIWDLSEDKCGIIPALRLSYHHLPSHLKRCFAYCSIFPKDYEFEEEEIILLRSAEGFLQHKAKHHIKDLGNRYFQDLVSRSFFQISNKDESRYLMHDLINDLAKLVAGDVFCRLEDNKQQMVSHRSRHSSNIVSQYDTVKKFEAFDQVNSLREGDGHRIGELKNLSNLRGDFCLSGLENVNDQEAREASYLAVKTANHYHRFGRLSSLKDLSIAGVDEVHKIGVELFGEDQSIAFASLETLSFESLPNWKEWDACEGDEQVSKFLSLRELSIRQCPQLLGRLPTRLQSLQKLEIEECRRLVVSISSFSSMRELSVKGCEELVDECSSAPMAEVSSLQSVNLSSISKFSIADAKRMLSLFLNAKLPVMLKNLDIWECLVLESIAQDFRETIDLEIIKIRGAQNTKSLPRGLNNLSHLQEITLWGSNLMVCEFPLTKLRVFTIGSCKNVGALPKCMKNFTSLEKLVVWECSADISFPGEGFPTNLASLEISGAPKIYSSPVEWGFLKLTSLKRLVISGEQCSNVVSFPDERMGMALPPSLTSIWISNLKNLEFMCSKGFQHLTSLELLKIRDCPKLTSLRDKHTLLSLGQSVIKNCPLLKEECMRVKGREWSRISHIPSVYIDSKDFIPKGLD